MSELVEALSGVLNAPLEREHANQSRGPIKIADVPSSVVEEVRRRDAADAEIHRRVREAGLVGLVTLTPDIVLRRGPVVEPGDGFEHGSSGDRMRQLSR
jgi:hypothetical protein